jgi:hypothetical protein
MKKDINYNTSNWTAGPGRRGVLPFRQCEGMSIILLYRKTLGPRVRLQYN